MNKRLIAFLSILILYIPLFSSDPLPNPDVAAQGATWTATTTVGGSTSYTPSPPLPNGSEITPNYGNSANGNHSITLGKHTGLFGFFYNLGRPSKKDLQSDKVREGIDKALAKAQAGTPLESADYDALGTADLTIAPQKTPFEEASRWAHKMQKHNRLIAQCKAENAASIAKQAERRETLRLAKEAQKVLEKVVEVLPVESPSSVPLGDSLPAITSAAPIVSNAAEITINTVNVVKILSPTGFPDVKIAYALSDPLRKMNDITILDKNPLTALKGINDINGGGGAGGVMQILGAGGVAAKGVGTAFVVKGGTCGTAAVAGGGTVTLGAGTGAAAGGTAVGGTATGTTVGGALVAAAPYIAAGAGIAIVTGYIGLKIYDGIYNPGIGWFTYGKQRQAYHDKRAAMWAKNNAERADSQQSSNKQNNTGNTTSGDRPGPQRPLTNKEARQIVKDTLPGFVERKDAPFNTHGANAFYNKKMNRWITPDKDCHNGGVWKMYRDDERLGTYTKDLIRIKG